MFKILTLVCGLTLACSGYADTLTIQNLPVSELEDHPVCYDKDTGKLGRCSNYIEISVDCGVGESLQTAIDQLPPYGQADLVISGVCVEDVHLFRSKTTLRSADPANKASIQTLTEPLNIARAREVSLENIRIADGIGGVQFYDKALVFLVGTEIVNNTGGLTVTQNSTASVDANNIIGPNADEPSLVVYNSGQAVVWGDNNQLISSDNAWVSIYMANHGEAGLWGANTVVTGAFALFNNSTMEMSAGMVFNGGKLSRVSSNSTVRLNGTHSGPIKVQHSIFYANGSSIGALEVDWNGTAHISSDSSYAGGTVAGSSHLQSHGTITADLTIKASAYANFPSGGNLDGNTVFSCASGDNIPDIDAAVRATGVVADCSSLPATSEAKAATIVSHETTLFTHPTYIARGKTQHLMRPRD